MYSNPKISNIEDSPFQKYLNWFEIDSNNLNFKELFYIKNVGLFISKEFLSHQLFLIELEKNQFTPTSFCYDFLKKKINESQNIQLSTIKWTNEFLYSKDIPIEHGILNIDKKKLNELSYYLIEFNQSIIGIGRIEKGKKFLLNIENISTYLFEEK